MNRPLSESLPGTWRLLTRIDVTIDGVRHRDPALGSDPIAILTYDRAGNFSAQFMKRDRSAPDESGAAQGANNTRAQDGYDAYFGTYSVDDETNVMSQTLSGSLSAANVGMRLSRAMRVDGDELTIVLDTNAVDGTPVTRTLTWERIG